MSMPSPSYGAPLHVPSEFYFNIHYSYPPWSYNSYMSFPPRYFCSDYITYKESAIKKSPPTSNDRFNHKNWSVQKKTHKMIKQVYHVKKNGRLTKSSDLTLDKEKPIVEETSVSSVDQIVPHGNKISKNITEQKSRSAGGKDDLKVTSSEGTDLTGDQTGLTLSCQKFWQNSRCHTKKQRDEEKDKLC